MQCNFLLVKMSVFLYSFIGKETLGMHLFFIIFCLCEWSCCSRLCVWSQIMYIHASAKCINAKSNAIFEGQETDLLSVGKDLEFKFVCLCLSFFSGYVNTPVAQQRQGCLFWFQATCIPASAKCINAKMQCGFCRSSCLVRSFPNGLLPHCRVRPPPPLIHLFILPPIYIVVPDLS